MGRQKANEQLGILPYYHAIENAVTKPNQGTFVTRYFRTKWRPALGNEASEIILAIRFLADKETGETFAGYDTIAGIAGLSVRSVERWLSHYPPKNRSRDWLEQWRLLHAFFILGKKKRYPEVLVGNRIERRRTTNIIRIAMDDPVHPDDEGQLYVVAAERMLEDEQKSMQTRELLRNRPAGGYGPAPYAVTVEKSSRSRPADGYLAPTSGRSRSYSDRSNENVSNVRVTSMNESDRPSSGFAQDPRVSELTGKQRADREALVLELGDWLRRKHGFRDTDAHKSAGAHRRAVFLGGPNLVRQAMRVLDDRIEEGRAGRKDWIRDPSAAFWGILRNLAAENGVSLDPAGQRPANRQNEALARPAGEQHGVDSGLREEFPEADNPAPLTVTNSPRP